MLLVANESSFNSRLSQITRATTVAHPQSLEESRKPLERVIEHKFSVRPTSFLGLYVNSKRKRREGVRIETNEKKCIVFCVCVLLMM